MFFFSRTICWRRESKNIFPSDTQSAILLLPGFSAFYIAVRNRFPYTWSESCAESTENVELLFISLCFPFLLFFSETTHFYVALAFNAISLNFHAIITLSSSRQTSDCKDEIVECTETDHETIYSNEANEMIKGIFTTFHFFLCFTFFSSQSPFTERCWKILKPSRQRRK